LGLTRRIADTPPEEDARPDVVGTVLSALGPGLIVYGVLRSGTWGFVQPKAGAPEWVGLSPVIWLILCGGVVLWVFCGGGITVWRAAVPRWLIRRCCGTRSCGAGLRRCQQLNRDHTGGAAPASRLARAGGPPDASQVTRTGTSSGSSPRRNRAAMSGMVNGTI